ncbi:Purine ribonucleoside efflux pump NepI [Frondihabitans sp. 762G35]|uniref:MFS transporter n=1 Tax=Frondihabitans sp. 762G35 TaxID=1446794 RepID=UPI000D20512A|nr:MFS transporter [Frondihabitans sp. 762G35]ARC58506.1 Purine ribonucleoside efflux pump NepI [Frondihabitans sp. 762G35]
MTDTIQRPRPTDATPQPHTLTAQGVVGIAVLGLATFLAITTELMPVGLLSTMSGDLGVSESQMGAVITVYALAVALLALPLTWATARFPRKTILVTTLAGYTVSNLVVALAPSFAVVCAGRVIGGVAHALFFSVASAYATRIVPPRLAGRAIAFVYSGSSLGFVIGVPVATTVGDQLGWRLAVGAVAAATAVLALVALAFLPSVHGQSHPHVSSARGWARSGLIAVVTADLLLFAGHYVVYTYIGPYLVTAGLGADAIGVALLVLGGTGIVGLLLAGAFVDRAPRQTLLAAVGVMALALAALPFVHGSLVGTFVVAGVWVAANGTTGTLFMAAAIRTGGVSPDIAGAMINAGSNVGIAGGAALGAQVFGGAGLGALPFSASVVVAASFVVIALARRGFPRHGHAQETLTTSSLRVITTSVAAITSSIRTVPGAGTGAQTTGRTAGAASAAPAAPPAPRLRATATVHTATGSLRTVTGSIRTATGSVRVPGSRRG